MGKIRYASWVNSGRPVDVAILLHDHPKYLRGLQLGTAIDDDFGSINVSDIEFAPSFTGEYARDAAGKPVHPYAEQLFAAGMAIEGPGAYWAYGPNLCADPVVLGVGRDGKLRTVIITRGDTGVKAFPGGHCNPSEDPRITAPREFHEETGIKILEHDIIIME
ncbi:MAG: NUDIX domain-containing protein [Candidatus Saccharimonadales bacterium]